MLIAPWQQRPTAYFRRLTLLKRLFWLYFLLLIFEGALRKWIFPQFSAPLLLIRDPIGMLIILEAYRAGKWPQKWSLVSGLLAGGLIGLCIMQVVAGDNPISAALYGLRSYLLPFPVAFVMGENLDAEDLRMFALCTLWIMLPETVLDAAQYMASADSWVNAGAYKGGAQIAYVGEHLRASGTFSFVVGPASYGPTAAVFLLYALVNEKVAQKWLLWAVTFALILSVPVVGSRSYLFELAAVVACAAVAAFFGVSQFLKTLRIVIPIMVVLLIVPFLPVFAEASQSFTERFKSANEAEGGGSVRRVIAHRELAPILAQFTETDFSSHPLGLGMGRGSAAITTLMSGTAKFIAGEGEFERVLVEFGPFPGLTFMLIRWLLTLFILGGAVMQARRGEPLALLFAPLIITGIATGLMEQPTAQGFTVMWTAFSLAALNLKRAVQPAQDAKPCPRPRILRYSSPGR